VHDERGSLADALKYAQAGTMLIAPMLAFGGIGYFLDRRFGTKPWLLLAGLLLGMVGGFVNFLRLVLPPRGGTGGTGEGAG
jgi:F0F1-type ATP synthase assembly protein I